MNNIAKQSIWLLLAALMLIGSTWYYKQIKPNFRLDSDALSTTIDSTVSQLTVRQYNQEGELANVLTYTQR